MPHRHEWRHGMAEGNEGDKALRIPILDRLTGATGRWARAGIQFSGERAALVLLGPDTGRPEILAAASVSADEAPAAFADLLGRHRLRKAAATLCLAPGEYELLNMERPPVPDEELAESVRWKLGDLLPWPVDEAQVDVFTIPGLDSHARAASWVFVVAARRALVERRLQQAERIGLQVTAVDIADFALRNLSARASAPQHSVAHLLVGEDYSLVCISRGEVLYFSRDLQIGLGVLREAGEAPEPGLSLEEGPRERLVLEVQRSLDYFDRHFAQPPVSRLIVSPPGTAGALLQDALSASLPLQVLALGVEELLPGAGPQIIESGLVDEPGVLLALGAAMRELPALAAEDAA